MKYNQEKVFVGYWVRSYILIIMESFICPGASSQMKGWFIKGRISRPGEELDMKLVPVYGCGNRDQQGEATGPSPYG